MAALQKVSVYIKILLITIESPLSSAKEFRYPQQKSFSIFCL